MRLSLIAKLHLEYVACLIETDFETSTADMIQWFNSVLLKYAPAYVQHKPDGLSPERQWPAPTEIVDSLAHLAKSNWPYVYCTLNYDQDL